MKIQISDEALAYLHAKVDRQTCDCIYLAIDVRVTQECCAFGVELRVEILSEKPANDIEGKSLEFAGISLFLQPEFLKYFPNANEIQISLSGKVRKQLVVTQPRTILRNVCEAKK